MAYRVFISHGWHDRWIAKQLARNVREDAQAEPFIDIFDVKKGGSHRGARFRRITELQRIDRSFDPLVGDPELGLDRDRCGSGL